MKRLATALTGLLLCAAAPGCLTVASDDGPILSVELFWDARPDSDMFVGGTCHNAGVESMEWKLILHKDGKDEVVAERDEPCANAIDVIVEPERGDYTLEVTGRDKDDMPLWSVECSGLSVLRFDVGYECDIEAP